jgi:hypothetical protein
VLWPGHEREALGSALGWLAVVALAGGLALLVPSGAWQSYVDLSLVVLLALGMWRCQSLLRLRFPVLFVGAHLLVAATLTLGCWSLASQYEMLALVRICIAVAACGALFMVARIASSIPEDAVAMTFRILIAVLFVYGLIVGSMIVWTRSLELLSPADPIMVIPAFVSSGALVILRRRVRAIEPGASAASRVSGQSSARWAWILIGLLLLGMLGILRSAGVLSQEWIVRQAADRARDAHRAAAGHMEQNNIEAALSEARRSLRIRKRYFGAQHRTTIGSMRLLCRVVALQGNASELTRMLNDTFAQTTNGYAVHKLHEECMRHNPEMAIVIEDVVERLGYAQLWDILRSDRSRATAKNIVSQSDCDPALYEDALAEVRHGKQIRFMRGSTELEAQLLFRLHRYAEGASILEGSRRRERLWDPQWILMQCQAGNADKAARGLAHCMLNDFENIYMADPAMTRLLDEAWDCFERLVAD